MGRHVDKTTSREDEHGQESHSPEGQKETDPVSDDAALLTAARSQGKTPTTLPPTRKHRRKRH